jgi:hypothetical protein
MLLQVKVSTLRRVRIALQELLIHLNFKIPGGDSVTLHNSALGTRYLSFFAPSRTPYTNPVYVESCARRGLHPRLSVYTCPVTNRRSALSTRNFELIPELRAHTLNSKLISLNFAPSISKLISLNFEPVLSYSVYESRIR